MLDFVLMNEKMGKDKLMHISPAFKNSDDCKDICFKGGTAVAVYDESQHIWRRGIGAIAELVDTDIQERAIEKYGDDYDPTYRIAKMTNSSSSLVDAFVRYCRNIADSTFDLNDHICYANAAPKRDDHATFVLPYFPAEGDCSGWDELVSTLYDPEERQKIEWFIGAVGTNSNNDIDRFAVFYGKPGSGKSTILNIINSLFAGYTKTLNITELGNANKNAFATESLASNPLVGIQQDGNLSHIGENSVLNSIISHEATIVNQKFKTPYVILPKTIMFMGTNKPVAITDAKSGIARRVIDIHPSGRLIEFNKYQELIKKIKYEYGAIIWHCSNVYRDLGSNAYRNYVPFDMFSETNALYGFLDDNFEEFAKSDHMTLKRAWDMYKAYAEDGNFQYKMNKTWFKNDLKEYYEIFYPDTQRDGIRYKNLYVGFKSDKIRPEIAKSTDTLTTYSQNAPVKPSEPKLEPKIELRYTESIFDVMAQKWPSQYATEDGAPKKPWNKVKTTLSDIDTTKVHYVRVPENHIVIDFDLKDANGNKDADANLKAAAEFPETYAEFSKGGAGVHLHYIYDGDVNMLSSVYAPEIEVKVFRGKSALRRRLTYCNDKEIAHISGGLPLREERKNVINKKEVKSEKALRTLVTRALRKEYGATRPSIDFIKVVTDEAYEGGTCYDISDLKPQISQFAMNSTHQSQYCMKAIQDIKWKSDKVAKPDPDISDSNKDEDRLVFFDIEVFPNLLLVNWKYDGKGEWRWKDDSHREWIYEGPKSTVNRMLNPTSEDIAELFKMKLIGYNNLRYDNIILYARYLGYNNQELYDLSQRIINGEHGITGLGQAQNVSYTDVYDFASAGNKKSLKKWEIELGMYHDELEFPWDQPIDEKEWPRVAAYCDNDVIATEGVFHYLKGDWTSRQMLAAIADMPVNTTSNQLTAHIIFGDLADRRY